MIGVVGVVGVVGECRCMRRALRRGVSSATVPAPAPSQQDGYGGQFCEIKCPTCFGGAMCNVDKTACSGHGS
jgi:hypothetical protein